MLQVEEALAVELKMKQRLALDRHIPIEANFPFPAGGLRQGHRVRREPSARLPHLKHACDLCHRLSAIVSRKDHLRTCRVRKVGVQIIVKAIPKHEKRIKKTLKITRFYDLRSRPPITQWGIHLHKCSGTYWDTECVKDLGRYNHSPQSRSLNT